MSWWSGQASAPARIGIGLGLGVALWANLHAGVFVAPGPARRRGGRRSLGPEWR